jgi:hypothetical protein
MSEIPATVAQNSGAVSGAPPTPDAAAAAAANSVGPKLEQGTYDILRARLAARGAELRERLSRLNAARQAVFGAIPTALVATERLTTENNCTPRDMRYLGGGKFIFGYNVQLGLRSETQLADVFSLYEYRDRSFRALPLAGLADAQFETDFKALYRYYKGTAISKIIRPAPFLFMEFRVGKSVNDIKTFKWQCVEGELSYLGNRFDHEYHYPPQHEFAWKRTHREQHRAGAFPHISIDDQVFVECIGGDLTVKVEDNTATGEGIYREPVEQRDQTLDDAEIHYAALGHLILLRIRPYQEKQYRYLVFNAKLRTVHRIDAIEEACALLPDGHGIIHPRGFYLQSGDFKEFEHGLVGLRFHKRMSSPNGEDTMFAFYEPESGTYVLYSYNVISRECAAPVICHGYSLFENGELAVFRAAPEPQRHHAVQIWQTPYVGADWQPAEQSDSYLYKLGNPAIVRAMAECGEILVLLGKDDTYPGLYLDLVKRTSELLDVYFWLGHEEAADIQSPLTAIKEAAASALAEFDKVSAIRRNTAAETQRVTDKVTAILKALPTQAFDQIGHFVARLAELRAVRGELISLKELRYVDGAKIEQQEEEVIAATGKLAQRTVDFLLAPQALEPLKVRIVALKDAAPTLPKATEAQKLSEEITGAAGELDLLVETVSNLKIADATETTRIIEDVSAIYAVLNQARAAVRARLRDLRGTEAVAEFASQQRLLEQALANYLDLATTPEKCDEFLNRLMVQVEELEARFADFEEFVAQLADKRTVFASAFEARKLELVEARNRRANGLMTAAERILKGIKNRADTLPGLDAIHSYFASDMMVEKVRDLTAQLLELGDTTKADDLQGRLKTTREDAVRQFKDRQDLFAGGGNAIQLGRHQFLVNTQELELTIVPRGEAMCLHITGTNFFEPITDAAFAETRPVWNLETVAETPELYRGEWLAWSVRRALAVPVAAALQWTAEERLARVREWMAAQHGGGYLKGVHDGDAAQIFGAMLEMESGLGLLRFAPAARTLAALAWQATTGGENVRLTGKLRGYGELRRAFPANALPASCVQELATLIRDFLESAPTEMLVPATGHDALVGDAAGYLAEVLAGPGDFAVSAEAAKLVEAFESHANQHSLAAGLRAAREAVGGDDAAGFALLYEWLRAFARERVESDPAYFGEAAWLLGRGASAQAAQVAVSRELAGLAGSHPRISGGKLGLHYLEFTARLRTHEERIVPLYTRFGTLKTELLERMRARLRLEGFKPKVLTSFIRNRLIDSAYLPLLGDNLAKQIGAAGDAKRTDRMGLLLLISPPGYGKTTLVEYIASRLGIVFMKINGPAIGHRVTSLDPGEAPNAAARDELEKLGLAFEMGDNVMICLDDIQHLSAEFLQKFISLCDGSRRIEGVWKGQPKTWDLRGRKVVVVMAGNPYTESGEKFKIPDMLANRADTYNLGDVAGAHAEAFRSSYLENAAGSNPTLGRLASRSQKDIVALLRLAETGSGDGVDFEGNWSHEEQAEFLSVMKKLLRVRDVVLRVNEEYIRSAAQSDAYRTEPAFKLQGSYRNMGRLAEKISPVMNDAELAELIQGYYRNEAQTLTTGTEANLLKFKELTGTLTTVEAARWEEIKKTFRKDQLFRGADAADPMMQVVQHLGALHSSLGDLRETFGKILSEPDAPPMLAQPITLFLTPPAAAPVGVTPVNGSGSPAAAKTNGSVEAALREVAISNETLRKIWELIEGEKAAGGKDADDEGAARL